MFSVKPSPRLVPSPVFILSTPHSGSTLLRNLLGTHSRVHATGELGLTEVGVEFRPFPARYGLRTVFTELVFGEAELDTRELEHLLWDRILHRELVASGKATLVHKAPRVLLRWRRLVDCWPDARFIFLLRHPLNILASGLADSGWLLPPNQLSDIYLRYLYLLQQAREELPGLTVRYEEVTTDATEACRGVCDFLGLAFEPAMVRYDWSRGGLGSGNRGTKMASGRVRPGRPLPPADEIPQVFRPICARLGYPTAS